MGQLVCSYDWVGQIGLHVNRPRPRQSNDGGDGGEGNHAHAHARAGAALGFFGSLAPSSGYSHRPLRVLAVGPEANSP